MMLPAEVIDPMRLAVQAALDKKAFHLVGIEVSEFSSYADSFLLCSGASDRQVGAIVDEVARRLKGTGRQPMHVEGERAAEWVLMDYGDFIVHVFTEEKRAYYGLDGLWGDAPRIDAGTLGVPNGDPADSS
jgi:ribosome-associated protein